MPKNVKKHKRFRSKNQLLIYADESNEQKYAVIKKELGNQRFLCSLLDKQERVCCLSRGTARKARRNGIKYVREGTWVLVQPMSSNINGKQEIVTVYNNKQHGQLEHEGKLAVVVEYKPKEDLGFIFESDYKNEDLEIDDDNFDIDTL